MIQSMYDLVLTYANGKRMASKIDQKAKRMGKDLGTIINSMVKLQDDTMSVDVKYKGSREFPFPR